MAGESKRRRPSGGADVSAPVDTDEVQKLVNVIDRQGFRGHDVVLAMPSQSLMTDVLDLPVREGEALAPQAVRQAVARAHRREEGSFEMAYWDLPWQSTRGGLRTVMTVACAHEKADAVLDVFEAAGLQVRGLDVHSWSVHRACTPMTRDSNGGLFILVDLGWNDARLVVLGDGVVVYERSLSDSGLNRVHLGLRNKLELAEDVSDYILERIGLAADLEAAASEMDPELLEDVQGYLRAYLDKIVSELKLSLDYVTQEFANRALDKVVLVGEGAGIPEIGAQLSKQLNLDVRSIAPIDVLPCRPLVSAQLSDAENVHGHGSCPISREVTMIKVNLIPTARLEAGRRRRRLGAWSLVLGSCGLFLLVAFFVANGLIVSDDSATRAELDRAVLRIQSAKARMAVLQRELSRVGVELQASRAVGGQPNWSVLLVLLSEALDPNVVLKSCRVQSVRPLRPSSNPSRFRDPSRASASSTEPEETLALRLEIEGLGRTPQAVSQFVLRLEESPLFSKVNPADTSREVFQGQYATAFSVECILATGHDHYASAE